MNVETLNHCQTMAASSSHTLAATLQRAGAKQCLTAPGGFLDIDGSRGEGGGQILRSSVALAAIFQQPIRIHSIRAGRSNPGLQRQHCVSVQACADICGANVSGLSMGSAELFFAPSRAAQSGSYRWAIDGAGSASLVLQTVLPALLSCSSPSTVEIHGGTHTDMAPSWPFLSEVFFPQLRAMGIGVDSTLLKPGFYPVGGGALRVVITPRSPSHASSVAAPPLALGVPTSPSARPYLLAARPSQYTDVVMTVETTEKTHHATAPEVDAARVAMQAVPAATVVPKVAYGARGAGMAVYLRADFHDASETDPPQRRVFFCGKPPSGAEHKTRASCCWEEFSVFLASGAAADEYLADQLMLPLLLTGEGGRYTAPSPVSLHSSTNIGTIDLFAKREDGSSLVTVVDSGATSTVTVTGLGLLAAL